MKLLRYGPKVKEKPVALDKNRKIKDILSHIKDFNSDNISFDNLEKLKKINLEILPEIYSSERTGTPPGVGMGKKPPIYLKPGDEKKITIDHLSEQTQKAKQYNE